jgi:hypothetical protein
MKTRRMYYVASVGSLAAVYLASAEISLNFASLQPKAAPLCPSIGIALAALLMFGHGDGGISYLA